MSWLRDCPNIKPTALNYREVSVFYLNHNSAHKSPVISGKPTQGVRSKVKAREELQTCGLDERTQYKSGSPLWHTTSGRAGWWTDLVPHFRRKVHFPRSAVGQEAKDLGSE